jgi:hypothetical protein
MRTRPLLVLVIGISALGATASPAPALAAAGAGGVRPALLGFTAHAPTGLPLPARGARVTLSVRVRNASRCTFLVQHIPFSSLYPLRTVSCAAGRASVTAPPVANPYQAPVRLRYGVRVVGAGGKTLQRSVRLAEAALPKPKPAAAPAPPSTAPPENEPTASLTLDPSSVPSSGGTVVASFASTNASSCTLASTPALWADANPLSVVCGGTYTFSVPASASGGSWTISFTASNDSGHSATATQTLTELAPVKPQPPAGGQRSSNWSGYAIPSDSIFTWVSGRWTVPQLNCAHTPNAGASSWVGIGGWGAGSGDLLQTGITMDCVNGSPSYFSWFELYPSNPNTAVAFAGLPVSAGDQIEAEVFRGQTGAWETRVDDLTEGLSGVMVTGEGWGVMPDNASSFPAQGSTASLSYGGGTSAEWIVEAYFLNGAQLPLADFGTIGFSDIRTSLSPWHLSDEDSITLVQNGVAVSTPSEPDTVNSGFTVSYTG